MSIVLFVIGLLVSAAGFVTIGFGIPINAFSLGNTLIIAGTIGVTTGLILIALAVLIGQLRRVAEALKTRPVRTARLPVAPAAVVTAPMAAPAAAAEPPAPRMPPPPAPEPAPVEAHAPSEPRFPATANEPPPPPPLDWLRAKSRPAAAPAQSAEPPMVEIPDEAPLSPRPPQRPAMPTAALEPALEPRLWATTRGGGPLEPRVAPRAVPQAEPPHERERFDLVWPDRAPAPSVAPPQAFQPSEPVKQEPVLDMPPPAPPPAPAPAPAAARPAVRAPERRPVEPPKPIERGPAILKSGVIDGMPYTLYADGSIEADLPTGTVKFASVDALRAHLEKQS